MKEIRKEYLRDEFDRITNEANEKILKVLYDMDKDTTKEEFVNSRYSFSTHSILNKDGDWIERGQMGWFGAHVDVEMSKEKWNNKYMEMLEEQVNEDDLIVIVDCHI